MLEYPKERYEQRSRVLKALAHPIRLWMAEQLAQSERCVCEFDAVLDVDFSTISRHLAVLRNAGIVADRKQGRQVFYRLLTPCLLEYVHCCDEVVTGGALS